MNPDPTPPAPAAGERTPAALFAGYYTRRTHQLWPRPDDPLDALARYALLPHGKLLRPRLLLLCVAALGGDLTQAAAVAAALESHHTASLVHDDLIDGDTRRRGRPSVHARFGTEAALLAGDALLCRSFADVAEAHHHGIAPRLLLDVIALAGHTGADICRGQLLEDRLRTDAACGRDAYLAVITLKTAALLRATCRCAALISGADDTLTQALTAYGQALGIAFQIRDDLLPYRPATAEAAARAGKPLSSDLRNRRPTLPLLLALEEAGPRQTRRLHRLFTRAGHHPRARTRLSALLRELGAVDAATTLLDAYVEQARTHLQALPPTSHREQLHRLTYAMSTS
ncbi:polyprenyl synthetase family protein [Streptomyces sp. ISL-11]|uniref:polyprenyl synthetase family protein n=1 Tax=Streptomyces sp. ISL-11 TaxID=2819174 RepID=UPI001BE76B07|nr:polyprenyl synthetase family protein [Streptomyces sp. ISL-11]MBT2387158.1 polyprenyl synthetase family protein [Streptomyces sp. ISL-11]